jgi:hypothetical protein
MNTAFKSRIAGLLVDPLAAARIAAEEGHCVIGYVGPDVPVELILAAGATPVRLAGKADLATPRADDFIERAFVPETRSVAEQWVAGTFDFMDSIVLPRSDDSAQRLYYYISELQRRGSCKGPRPLIYDIASIDRPSSTQHTIAATMQLARELGARQGTLPHAIAEVAEQTRVLRQIAGQQQSDPPLRGSAALGLARTLHFSWNAQFRRDLQDYLKTLAGITKMARVLLVGNAAPDDRLHRVMENAGACVVRELTEADWFADRASQEPPVQSFEAIGERAHARASLSRTLARSDETILSAARAVRSDAVVIWLLEEDSTLGWTLPGQLAALERAGVPALTLTRQEWVAQPDTVRAIERFCSGLGGRR